MATPSNITAAANALDNQIREGLDALPAGDFMVVYADLVRFRQPEKLSATNTRRLRVRILGVSESFYADVLAGRGGSIRTILSWMTKYRTAQHYIPGLPDLNYKAVEAMLLASQDG